MTNRRNILRAAALVAATGTIGVVPRTAAPAPSAQPLDGAGRYMVAVVRDKLNGNYERAWRSLYPPHQRVAPQAAYCACESLVPSVGRVLELRATRIYSERIRVAGARRRIETRAVRVRVGVLTPLWPVPVVVEQTFHAVRIQRHWTWVLSNEQYAYYRDGTCPYD